MLAHFTLKLILIVQAIKAANSFLVLVTKRIYAMGKGRTLVLLLITVFTRLNHVVLTQLLVRYAA